MMSNDGRISRHPKRHVLATTLQGSMLEYWQSKQINKWRIGVKDEDVSAHFVNVEWMYAMSALHTADECLRLSRHEKEKAHRHNNIKWMQLRHKGEQLHDSFIKFQQFVVENAEKRKRAQKKIGEEEHLKLLALERLKAAREQYAFLTDVKAKMEMRTREFRIYSDYLNQVLEAEAGSFRTIHDIIVRHAALREVRDEIDTQRSQWLQQLDDANAEFAELATQSSRTLMKLISQHVTLLARYEAAHSKALLWEAIVTRIKNVSREKERELAMVRESVHSVYTMMNERKGSTPATTNLGAQLGFIKLTLGELQMIQSSIRRVSASRSVLNFSLSTSKNPFR